MAEFCASFSNGCTETQLIKYGLGLGNTTDKIMEYISVLGTYQLGLITRIADRYFVDELNFIEWAEINGFRERKYIIQCKNPGCEASYGSKEPKCPECSTQNPFILVEAKGYTHIEVTSIAENDEAETTDLDTHIHAKRQARVKEGKDAEKKASVFLSQFGESRVGAGRGGEPDIFFSSLMGDYAVEVKSVNHQIRGKSGNKAGSVPLSVGQWSKLLLYSELNDLVPLLLVEVKISGSNRGSTYHFIPHEAVDNRLDGFSGKDLRISVHDLAAMSIQTIREGLPVLGGFRL